MYDFITIDFETANNNMNSACALGIVAIKDLEIVKTEYFLIKPPTEHFRHENVEIHGLTYHDVKNCDSFPCIYTTLANYIENSKYVLAHNAQFDMTVLNESLKTYNIPDTNFVYIDTINFSSKVRKNCGNSLSDCANYFSIDMGNHHNALDDAITCAKIAIASVNSSRFNSFESYLKMYSSIRQKEFSKLKSTKQMHKGKTFKKFESIKISELSAATSEFNTSHPFFNKVCVITGELQSLGRKDAMQKIMDVGGIVKSSVSSKTDYLIVGIQDKSLVGEDGLSTKEEKAYALQEKGAKIKIITEDEFLTIL